MKNCFLSAVSFVVRRTLFYKEVLADYRRTLDFQDAQIAEQAETIKLLNGTINDRDKTITELEEKIVNLHETTSDYREVMAEQEKLIADLKGQLNSRPRSPLRQEVALTRQERLLAEQREVIIASRATIADQDKATAHLQGVLAALQETYAGQGEDLDDLKKKSSGQKKLIALLLAALGEGVPPVDAEELVNYARTVNDDDSL